MPSILIRSTQATMRNITVDDLFRLEQLGRHFGSAYAVSPDGRSIAFVLQRAKASATEHKFAQFDGRPKRGEPEHDPK
jgi:hypothetical protein